MLSYQFSTMKSLSLLLMCFFFCCCYNLQLPSVVQQPPSGVQQPPSGFRLAQQWPAAFCNLSRPNFCNRNKLNTVVNFTIHGLWPYNSKGISMLNCSPESHFQDSMVRTIRTELNKAWPNFGNGRNEVFWNHEWEKHGTCSLVNGTRYFEAALNLKNKFDILKTLEEASIVPRDRSYKAQAVFSAIKKKLNFAPELICKKNRATGKFLLQEVSLCVDKGGKQFVNCELNVDKSCFGQNFFFIAGNRLSSIRTKQ